MNSERKEIRLGDVCSKIGSGATPRGGKESYLERGPISLIRSQNIYNEGFKQGGIAYITEEQARKLDNVVVEDEDVLLNITGDSVARVCLAPTDFIPARVNQHVAIIRTYKNILLPKFLLYYLCTQKMQNYMLGLAASGATRSALTKGMIESFPIYCPALKEQRKIIEVLSAIDNKIDLNKKTNETLENIARSLFKSWFLNFDPVRTKMNSLSQESKAEGLSSDIATLFPEKLMDSPLGEIPQGWKVRRVEEVIHLAYGKALKADIRTKGEILVYGSNGPIGFHSEALVKGPGVIIGRKGNPGIVKFTTKDFFPIDTTFYVQLKSELSSMIFAWLMLENLNLPMLSGDSAVPGLNRDAAYSRCFILPPSALIQCFNQIVTSLISRSANCLEQIETLSKIRDVMLPKLISGELCVNDMVSTKEII